MRCFENREAVVSFVSDLLKNSESGWPLTMTIRQVRSGGYSVSVVINSSLVDIGKDVS